MKKAYRIYNERTGECLLSFVATNDEEARVQARNFCKRETEAMRLERYRRLETFNPWTPIDTIY